MMKRNHWSRFAPVSVLRILLLGAAFPWVGAGQAEAFGLTKTYGALGAYFDVLSTAAAEDPWIEYFGVKETQSLPNPTMVCKEVNSQWALVVVSTWLRRVESDLNQNLQMPVFLPKQAESELSGLLSEQSNQVCQETIHQDLSTTKLLYLKGKGQNFALVFEVGYED